VTDRLVPGVGSAWLCVWLVACGGTRAPEPDKPEPERKDLGTAVGETTADTNALREANTAVNAVIRNATDCEVAKPAVAEAYAKLDEVDRLLKTATGKVTLAAMRKQVDRVAEVCP
jgi:hypothetical protein